MPVESGAQCWDGIDNNNNGLIDCLDSGCAESIFCRENKADATADSAISEAGPPDSQVSSDIGQPPRDGGLPRGDGLAPSQLGKRCQNFNTMPPSKCSDNVTVCLKSDNASEGFCTLPCNNPQQPCANGPVGTNFFCLLQFDAKNYCQFICRIDLATYSCPTDLSCVKVTKDQSNCY